MEINGYRVHLVQRTANSDLPPGRIYWKQHRVRATEQDKPMDKTLYIAELPTFLKIQHNLQLLMTQFGEVKRIIPSPPRSNDSDWSVFEYAKTWEYESACVVFKKSKYLREVLSLNLEERLIVSKDGKDLKTSAQLCEEEDFVDMEAGLKRSAEFMRNYALEHRAAEDQKEAAKEGEDGWLTVSKKYKPVSTPAAAQKKLSKKTLAKQRKLQLVNFYAFQERERKKKMHANSTREWQDSLEKIAQLRQSRKFKPL